MTSTGHPRTAAATGLLLAVVLAGCGVTVPTDPDGTLDTGFGGTGIVVTAVAPGTKADQAMAVAFQRDERVPTADAEPDVSVRWAVLGEVRGSAEKHVLLGGLHVGIGVCTPPLVDVLYGCARGDAGVLFGDRVEMSGQLTAELTGGVSLEVGVHLARGLTLELGPRIELSHALVLSDVPAPPFPTQLMLGGLVRAGFQLGDVGIVAELEASGTLPPFQRFWYPGLGGPVLMARVGVGF